ncbi:tRNA (N6-threonylcarbamoyladenosine(37)-N6)-methyltransferase TrmO [Methylobacterium durans]|uniref:tRNA (N6-threonylcarbamoyladenosine(37)-N6)-methyltransferase TrmO n=1 Tax=Methylobacterium durans TaxID=2202825 RepID=A0A2U8WDM2_9HYPH|nr:tRNA (N6-threonylcarbamoyladenosine(37)-N6)-methyltransferase TrmO [Methylobacterium durans]AWN39254.1 tRNA (N6-threonylcarbamoyladenosine(37)-N6)-methyltransferase TrmO [Methylobacterium durans]AWN44267.1 tRNA (N6-threonylcarbamoyladenosine(37)-N6)-methyltransferase TrmO [Methylobacterium durans]
MSEVDGASAEDGFERRPGEEWTALPTEFDAGLYFIGRISTPWTRRSECPKNGRQTNAVCTVRVDPAFVPALQNVEGASHLILLYWMDRAARNLVRQRPRHADGSRGTFSLRSPARPNPVALSVVELIRRDGDTLVVQGLDCLDGTPLLDIKPYYASTDSRPEATVERSGR